MGYWLGALAMLAAGGGVPAGAADSLVYVGTYTGTGSKGIYGFRFSSGDGRLKPLGLAAATANPSWLAAHPDGVHLYAVNEADEGAVVAFRIDRTTGKLSQLGRVQSHGKAPCALAVDATGRSLLAANYGTGTLALVPVESDGNLAPAATEVIRHEGSSVNKERQSGPHAHSADFSPGNRFALSCDLGLDRIFVYPYAAENGDLGQPLTAAVEPGSGPRHLVFHPSGRWVYVVTEMASTVAAFTWDGASGALRHFQTVATLPADYHGERSGGEIAVDGQGRFLYVSNRKEASSITVFAIDETTGRLTEIERVPAGGSEPRHFAIDPTGAWMLVALQKSDRIVTLRIDRKTGRLSETGISAEVGSPVCVRFIPAISR